MTGLERSKKAIDNLASRGYGAAVFDLDGLLIDTERFWRAAERDVFSSVGVRVTDQLQAVTASMTTEKVTRFWYERFPWSGASLRSVEDAVVQRVRELMVGAVPMEGARNILASFGSVGLKVALASNSPRALCEHALKSVGLIDYFDEITSAEQVSAGKPDPSVYLEAAKRIRVNPKRCIAFEDSLVGAQAACAAQMRVFVVPSRRQEIPEMNRLGISLITSLERFEFPAWRPGRY